jgi:cell division protein FtsZ
MDMQNDLLEGREPQEAKIRVVGVGGGGGNALDTMMKSGMKGVDFIAANTDIQALRKNLAPIKLHVGHAKATKGLGAGANPELGHEAAQESRDAIAQALEGSDMVFITAGMGGGTGTAAPARAARPSSRRSRSRSAR